MTHEKQTRQAMKRIIRRYTDEKLQKELVFAKAAGSAAAANAEGWLATLENEAKRRKGA